jgi:hypothetical protein
MTLNVYFKDDIAQGVAAITVAILSAAAAHGGTNVEYARGTLDFARAQAMNYGIPWPGLAKEIQAALSNHNILLDTTITNLLKE